MMNSFQQQIRSISQQLINNKDQEGLNILLSITGSIDTSKDNSTQIKGLLKMFDYQLETSVKKIINPKVLLKVKNYGFSVTNPNLEILLKPSKSVRYNPEKHVTIKDLGYKSNYELNKLGKKRWENFKKNGGKIFIQIDTKKSKRNLVKYLFSKSQSGILKKNITIPKGDKKINYKEEHLK